MFDSGMIHRPRIRDVQIAVAELHKIPIEAMRSPCRKHDWAHPRQEAMALARELTCRSFPEIGLMFGDRHHTTVMFAIRKIRKRAETDAVLADRLALARARIAELVAERVAKQPTPTGWQPPALLRLVKPMRISVRRDLEAWVKLGGEVVA